MNNLLRNRVVIVPGKTMMSDVILTMRDQNISSVLVTNSDDHIVGIITERDIVRKFTLLEVPDKLEASALTVMSRPVQLARLAHLEEDVKKLFKEHGYRHFPVTKGSLHKKDLMGILTVTDLANAWLTRDQGGRPVKNPTSVAIVITQVELATAYRQLFQALGYNPLLLESPEETLRQAVKDGLPVLLDMDDMPLDVARDCLLRVKRLGAPLVLLSSDPKLVEPLQHHLQGPMRTISLKPLDVSRILKFLAQTGPKTAENPLNIKSRPA